jgi:hypothetical protein
MHCIAACHPRGMYPEEKVRDKVLWLSVCELVETLWCAGPFCRHSDMLYRVAVMEPLVLND